MPKDFVSLADWRQIAVLSLPAVTLVVLIALRIGLTLQR